MRTLRVRTSRREFRRDEDGYLLLYVLGIIGLTSVLVIALLGLALTSARVAAMEARLARETRAADGALEAQIAAVAARGGPVCDGSFPAQVQDPALPGNVTVECTTAGVASPGQMLPGPDVEIVGTTNYAGGVTPSMTGVTDANLVVNGTDGPARFDSDLLVGRGAAVGRNSGNPAVLVAGQYQQGSTVGGAGCGVLGSAGANRIADEGGTGAPSCGTAPSFGVIPAPEDVAGIVRPSTGRDFNCPNNASISLAPGAYSADDIHKLNLLVSSPNTSTCTVVFAPGVHYLDVFDPLKPANQNILEISNPNIRVIGGVPVPSATTAAFPGACQIGGSAPGVQMILSPRSGINHTAGRVALCPAHVGPGGAAKEVLRQSGTTSSQPVIQTVTSTDFSNPNLIKGTGAWSSSQVCTWFFVVTCGYKSFTSTWSSTGSGPLDTARVILGLQTKAGFGETAAGYHNDDVAIRFRITKGSATCLTDSQKAGRAWGGTMVYDLLNSTDCRSKFTDAGQLNGSTVETTFNALGDTQLVVEVRNMRIETNVRVLSATNTGASDARWIGVGNARSDSDSGASARVDQVPVTFPVTIPNTFWELPLASSAASRSVSMSLAGFSLPSGLQPTDRVDRLGVMMRGPANELSFLADPVDGGKTTLTLTTEDGSKCTVASDSYGQSNGYVRYDLLTGSCASKVITAEQLKNSSLQLTITTGCTVPQAALPPAGKCSSVGIPKVDHLALLVGTDTYHGATPPISVTSNPGGATSFDVFGPVLLPSTDLNVTWGGTADPSRPIFDGKLMVHGLGVVQQPGAVQGSVCCVVDNSAAVLVARVNGAQRGQAAIRIDPTTVGTVTLRRPVEVATWQLCSRASC